MRHVIVGLHAAGRTACQWLRRSNPDAEIIGVDPSVGSLYSRPLISYVLSREMQPAAMFVAGEEYWRDLGVTLVRERAVGLDADRGRLALESGRELPYDRLLLACGARPRPVDTGGPLAGEVCSFRGRRDLERILTRVVPGGVAAVLGGGLVGFKLTMGLLKRGMAVKLLVTSPQPLSLNVDEHVGRWVGDRLRDTPGVELLTSTSVVAVEPGRSRALRLVLDSGAEFEVDLAAAGKGVTPETGWLGPAGPERDYGVLTDSFLRTSDERIHAAGDLAQAPDVVFGDRRVNAIWPAAMEQGRIAALNMAGIATPYGGTMAMNAIPVFGSQMISVGAVNPRLTRDCEFEEAGGRGRSYLRLVFREDRLIGAVGLDAPPRLGELAWAIRRGLRRRELPARWLRGPANAAPLAAAQAFLPPPRRAQERKEGV